MSRVRTAAGRRPRAGGGWAARLRRRRCWMRAAQRQESGQTVVEFAITLTILLTSVFTLMEICLMFYTYATISECAREGTRYAMVRGSSCVTAGATGAGASCTASTSSINSYVASLRYPNVGGGTMTVNTTFSADAVSFTTSGNNAPNDIVRVQITYNFPVKLPFVPKNSLTLKSQSQIYIVQ
jgi:Flp pilus assembly protein TadG